MDINEILKGVKCDACGKTVGSVTSYRFDFGSAGVEAGYTGVSAEDAYSAEVGYGFASTDAVENVAASGTGVCAVSLCLAGCSSYNCIPSMGQYFCVVCYCNLCTNSTSVCVISLCLAGWGGYNCVPSVVILRALLPLGVVTACT